MCGITGFINFNSRPAAAKQILGKMCLALAPRGHDDHGTYVHKNAYLGHQRLSIIDPAHGHQPLSFTYHGTTYTIVYNGEIYNADRLRKKLAAAQIKLQSTCDTELVLKCFALDGEKCLRYLNGIFAFVIYDSKQQSLFLARDQLGVKPLFYYYRDGQLAFASEIKALFQHPAIHPIVNHDGLRELFGIAPARTPGKTVYANIFEIKPAHCGWFRDGELKTHAYFKLKSRPHRDDAPTTARKIRQQLTDIVRRQLVSDVEVGTFLSGGLDSSIITCLAAQQPNLRLQTFSIDYVGNAEHFTPTAFTPSRDNYYIDLVARQINADHHYKLLNSADLCTALRDALHARDYPAMADIDSSLWLFCREVKPAVSVALSGEFADEIFCGYPWFYRADTINATTFPWAIDTQIREQTVAKSLRAQLKLSDYIAQSYAAAIREAPVSPADSPADRRMKIYSYLTMHWFGLNLLERTDRMAMHHSLEVRVPFTDPNLVQYVYNIPWSMKNWGGQEKGILRAAFQDTLPKGVLDRKKCPYPKTVDPVYTQLLEQRIAALLDNEEHPLWRIVEIDYVAKVLRDTDNPRPWFGQLMNRPQYLAFIWQIAMWLDDYQIILAL